MQRSGETVSPKSQQNNLCLVCPGASRTYHCSLLFACLVYSRGATAQFKVITHGFSSEFQFLHGGLWFIFVCGVR